MTSPLVNAVVSITMTAVLVSGNCVSEQVECADGWTESGGMCYFYLQTVMNFAASIQACGKLHAGASLAKIETPEQSKVVAELVVASGDAWIGAKFNGEGTYWSDGSPVVWDPAWEHPPYLELACGRIFSSFHPVYPKWGVWNCFKDCFAVCGYEPCSLETTSSPRTCSAGPITQINWNCDDSNMKVLVDVADVFSNPRYACETINQTDGESAIGCVRDIHACAQLASEDLDCGLEIRYYGDAGGPSGDHPGACACIRRGLRCEGSASPGGNVASVSCSRDAEAFAEVDTELSSTQLSQDATCRLALLLSFAATVFHSRAYLVA